MAKKSGREILAYFKNPALLECRICPCNGISCEFRESCASAFCRFIFEEG
jgi:hypothetical protein